MFYSLYVHLPYDNTDAALLHDDFLAASSIIWLIFYQYWLIPIITIAPHHSRLPRPPLFKLPQWTNASCIYTSHMEVLCVRPQISVWHKAKCLMVVEPLALQWFCLQFNDGQLASQSTGQQMEFLNQFTANQFGPLSQKNISIFFSWIRRSDNISVLCHFDGNAERVCMLPSLGLKRDSNGTSCFISLILWLSQVQLQFEVVVPLHISHHLFLKSSWIGRSSVITYECSLKHPLYVQEIANFFA